MRRLIVALTVILTACFALFMYHELTKKTQLYLSAPLTQGRELRLVRENYWEVHCTYWAEWRNGGQVEARQLLGYWGIESPELTVSACGDVVGILQPGQRVLVIYDLESGARAAHDAADTEVAQRLLRDLSACGADPLVFAE